MPKVIGGILAILALGASLLAQVDPVTTLMRGLIAYVIGSFCTQVWYLFFTIRAQKIGQFVEQVSPPQPADSNQDEGIPAETKEDTPQSIAS